MHATSRCSVAEDGVALSRVTVGDTTRQIGASILGGPGLLGVATLSHAPSGQGPDPDLSPSDSARAGGHSLRPAGHVCGSRDVRVPPPLPDGPLPTAVLPRFAPE